jgi:hypothetical protein
MRIDVRAAGFVAAAALYLALTWLASRGVHVHVGGDTTAYEDVARNQLRWGNIFSTQRPPIYPLLFRLLGFSRLAVVVVQTAASLAAWTWLAWVLGRGRVLPAAVVFAVALYPGFAAWNHVLMTESLEISLTAAAFACLLLFLDGTRPALWAFVAIMALKCCLRSFDALLDLFWIPIIAGFALFRRTSWLTFAVSSALFLGCSIYFNAATGTGADDVWYFALLDNIGKRVLPDPRWLSFFAAHGMPVNGALLSMTGKWANEDNWRFWTDPQLADFRHWLTAHGRAVLSAYLVQHPAETFALLWQHRDEAFQAGAFRLGYYFDPAYEIAWPPFGIVYAADTLGVAALLLGLALQWVPHRLLVPSLTAAGIWASLVPLALVAVCADPQAIDRHALPVQVQAALCLLLLARIAASRWNGLNASLFFFGKKEPKNFCLLAPDRFNSAG